MDEPWSMMLSEGSQTQPRIVWFHLYERHWTGKIMETKSRLTSDCPGLVGVGEMGVNGEWLLMDFLLRKRKCSEMEHSNVVEVVTQPCKYIKNLLTILFESMNFMLCKLCLSWRKKKERNKGGAHLWTWPPILLCNFLGVLGHCRKNKDEHPQHSSRLCVRGSRCKVAPFGVFLGSHGSQNVPSTPPTIL